MSEKKIIQFQPTRNDKPPFQEFYQDNYQRVLHYTAGKIGNFHDAEDLVGEIFIYCYSHYDDFDPEKSSITTWLYLIVNSRIKNHYRDAHSNVDLDSLMGTLADETDMDACIYLEQLKSLLEKALAILPERQRTIVTMRYFEEKSHAEIAQILGMTPGNVRVQLSRALDILEKKCGNILEGVR